MDAKEFQKRITDAIAGNKLVVGAERAAKLLASKKTNLVIFSNNCPEKTRLMEIAGRQGVPVYEFPKSNVELGELCKKPFRVSVVSVMTEG